jgi:predicted PilT family ATPase
LSFYEVLCPFQIEVNPEYHPKIIGKKGAVISKIRSDHGVQINFAKKGDPDEHIIIITGYEQNTQAARDDIMKIVNELVSQILVTLYVQGSTLKFHCRNFQPDLRKLFIDVIICFIIPKCRLNVRHVE